MLTKHSLSEKGCILLSLFYKAHKKQLAEIVITTRQAVLFIYHP